MSLPDSLKSQIDEIVRSSDVVLFMKGSRRFPQCGFSSQCVQILDKLGTKYKDVNVLQDPALRDGIKTYSEWPTIPQLYVKGQFVGGCDIMKEMSASGELAKIVGAPPKAEPKPLDKLPTLTVSDSAAAAIKAAAEPGDLLRFEIATGFRYDLSFGPKQPDDVEVQANGVTIVMDIDTARVADQTAIGFVDGPGGGFKIENPNQPASVKQLSATDLKAKLDKGEALHLFDVRTDAERTIAVIPAAKPFDPTSLNGLEKNAPLVFHCHHGGRSQAAAERAIADGFKDVSNLKGGIDAWSQSVDASVKRY